MKSRNYIAIRIAKRRHRNKLKSKYKRYHKRRLKFKRQAYIKKLFVKPSLDWADLFEMFMPSSLMHMMTCEQSPFNFKNLFFDGPIPTSFYVPHEFSIVDYPKECYNFLQNVLTALYFQTHEKVILDYKYCKRVDLGAQVLLDIILRDILLFFRRCKRYRQTKKFIKVREITSLNIHDGEIRKMLFSVGSPAVHLNRIVQYNDIIPYTLCIHDSSSNRDYRQILEQKDLDTTRLVDYVLSCLKRLKRDLSPEHIDDLSTVIGEILINAEEHSTTNQRFSIGYFHEKNDDEGIHFGVFRLVILNFGKTIYEKFADPNCPNKMAVEKMKAISAAYTRQGWFTAKSFEEETLWTLYSLQEGITSVDPGRFRKRGNGSIQFIESFFNLRGESQQLDFTSRLAIMSGNAKIEFDGTYAITKKEINGEEYKYMTFNASGNIEDKPNTKYVSFADEYFPGTIISAKILFQESIKPNDNG